jgi:hypothetical protein
MRRTAHPSTGVARPCRAYGPSESSAWPSVPVTRLPASAEAKKGRLGQDALAVRSGSWFTALSLAGIRRVESLALCGLQPEEE